jgi:hypothetical protein
MCAILFTRSARFAGVQMTPKIITVCSFVAPTPIPSSNLQAAPLQLQHVCVPLPLSSWPLTLPRSVRMVPASKCAFVTFAARDMAEKVPPPPHPPHHPLHSPPQPPSLHRLQQNLKSPAWSKVPAQNLLGQSHIRPPEGNRQQRQHQLQVTLLWQQLQQLQQRIRSCLLLLRQVLKALIRNPKPTTQAPNPKH